MIGTVESYFKRNCTAIQNSTFSNLKIRTQFYKSPKKTENCYRPIKVAYSYTNYDKREGFTIRSERMALIKFVRLVQVMTKLIELNFYSL